MARTSTTQPTGSRTTTTPDREIEGDHPVGTSSPESPAPEEDSPAEMEALSENPAHGPTTRSHSRSPHLNDKEDEYEETEGEEDPSEGGSLSGRDEALSEGESSYGDDSQFAGPPNLQGLIRLGVEHCRSPCRLTNKDGVKTSSICGKKAKSCQRHAKARLGKDSYQYAIGSYPPVPVTRGFPGHGLAGGPYYTDYQIQAFRAEEEKEMGRLVQDMNANTDDADEMEELAQDLRVRFKPTESTKASSRKKDPTDDLRRALAAATDGPSRKKKSTPPPDLWFGMIEKKGVKWITSNPTEANHAATRKNCHISQVFYTQDTAEEWLEEEESDDDEIPPLKARSPGHGDGSEDDSSDPDVDAKTLAKADRRKKKNQARRALQKQAKKDEKNRKSEKKKSVAKPRPPHEGRSRSSGRRHGSKKRRDQSDDSSDPSDPSSNESESSDDSSNSESSASFLSKSNSESSDPSSSSRSPSSKRHDQHSRKKKSQQARAKKNKDKDKKNNKKDNFHKFQHEDPSTGDTQRVYGMSINGLKIDEAVAPNSMRRSEHGSMYTAAVDVTSLPGGWNSNKGVSEEMFQESQKIAQLTSTILASTNKLKGMEVNDTSWNSTIRHSLGRVRTREDLFEFVRKLRKSKKAAFRQEGNLIQHYLYQRHYSGRYIREYVRSSLLSVISKRSFKSFFDLGDAIRQLAYDHPRWDGGPAKAMLSFHSEKLMEIRQFAVSRKQLILQVYTYLRDAQAKDFYHESMAGAIWERIGNLDAPLPSGGGGGGGGNEATRCGWCNQKEMHRLFNLPGQRNVCPVKDLTDKSKAKEAAKWIVDQKRADPSKELQELLTSALSQFA